MKPDRLRELLDIAADVVEELTEDFLKRTEVRETRRFGPHIRTVYNDGRETVHTRKQYPGEQIGVSFYDMMQLGMKLPDLHPKFPEPYWMGAMLGIAAVGMLPWMKSFLKED